MMTQEEAWNELFRRVKELDRRKSCPFCGETNLICISSKYHKDREDNTAKWTATVTCLNCFAEICNHGFDWTEEEAIEKAIKAWNRRAYDD